MSPTTNRIDPSQLTEEELDVLSELMRDPERPMLVGREGVKITLPDPLFHALVRVIREVKQGNSVVITPENESLTTKLAAQILGMSRPYFVTILDKGEIPHHKVGTHRRVYLKDVVEFQRKRDSSRRVTLDKMFDEVDKAGLY